MNGERAAQLRRLRRGLAIGLLVVATIAARVVISGASEQSEASAADARGDMEGALVHYRRAARWYAPLSPYPARAIARLSQIGAEAERRGDSELALRAYRAVRVSLLSTRSFYTPESERLQAANERIATLMARQPPPPMDAGKSEAELRNEHLALLSADPGPKLSWTLVLLAGFVAWVGGAFALTLRAVDDQDQFIPSELKRWGTLVLVGFGLFVLGMSLA